MGGRGIGTGTLSSRNVRRAAMNGVGRAFGIDGSKGPGLPVRAKADRKGIVASAGRR
jgi:hypothetical protein